MTQSAVEASFEYLEALYHRPIMPPAQAGLRRTETLLELLGDPHTRFPSVHITGTCGKGSTATMTGAILQAAGYRTGVFRSPHLETYRERIAVNDAVVSEDEWMAVFEPVRSAAQRMETGQVPGYHLGRVSLFELVWAMAALHFARSNVDFAVVEVGIGGRLSPTNVLSPEVAVVTNVSLDHTGFLGPTVVDIAREKSQIIKPGSAATSAATQPEVIDVIRERATETGSKLWMVGSDVAYDLQSQSLTGERFAVTTPRTAHTGLSAGMLGRHQVINAATAVCAVDQLVDRGFRISEDAIRTGLGAAHYAGRFEVISSDPPIILDGARNVASAGVLADTLETLFPGRDITLLIGILGDKDARGIIDILTPGAVSAVATQPPWEGRTGDPSRMLDALRLHIPDAVYEPEIEVALDSATRLASEGSVLVVTGSLYLVAAVRHSILKQRRAPPLD